MAVALTELGSAIVLWLRIASRIKLRLLTHQLLLELLKLVLRNEFLVQIQKAAVFLDIYEVLTVLLLLLFYYLLVDF